MPASPLRVTLLSLLALVGTQGGARAAPAATLSMTKLQAVDNVTQAGDGFGFSVSIYGTTMMIGAPAAVQAPPSGAVYVFGPSGQTWVQRQKLSPSDGSDLDEFGESVSLDGLTALVGAPGATSGTSSPGAAYVWTRMGATWTQQQKLVAVDETGTPVGMSDDQFGVSVSVSGDVALVGSPHADGWFGAAYVFVRSGSTWTLQQKLTASDLMQAGTLGTSVAVSGDTAVAGAPYANINGGAVYVFVRSGSTWTMQQRLQPNDAVGYDGFGQAVALAGDTLLAGPYVFSRAGTHWTQEAKVSAPDDALMEPSGAVSASIALVGSQWASIGPYNPLGAVYLFTPGPSGWTLGPQVVAPDGVPNDLFGASVAFSGTTFVVGAPGANSQGAAYVGVLAGVDAQPVLDPAAGSEPADAAAQRSGVGDAGGPSPSIVDSGPAATGGDAGVDSRPTELAPLGSGDTPVRGADTRLSHGGGCACAVSQDRTPTGLVAQLVVIALWLRRLRFRRATRHPPKVDRDPSYSSDGSRSPATNFKSREGLSAMPDTASEEKAT
jgi:MYXO-CTERM domain-containing protein